MNRDEVVLYICDITDADADSLFNEYGLSFDRDRLVRISQCKNEKARGKLIATGALLAKVLNKYGLELSDVSYAEYGKPFIANNKGIYFNLSHSGAYVVIAVSGQPIGVDVQKKVSINERVIDKICDEDEAIIVKANCMDILHKVWSYKEAAAKLHGDGIVNGMDRFSMDYSKNESKILFKGQTYGYVKFHAFYEDYALAVACKEPFNIVHTAILEDF